jgi:chemotaxis protein MotB
MADRPDFGGGKGGEGGVTIIKRIKKGGEGDHGGAWKVAYADFVTAMMAFFLLLWLLNAVTEEQLNGIADYFTPIAASTRESGAGGMLGGQTLGEGASQSRTGSTSAVVLPPPSIGSGGEDSSDPAENATDQEQDERSFEAREQREFEQAATEIKRQISGIPELAPLASSLLIDNTPEGLRIQIVDQDRIDMFAPGSANLYPRAKELLAQIARVLKKLPNKLSISGHTDPSGFVDPTGYTNWELSSDRALATRRALIEGTLEDNQIQKVTGVADREPIDAQTPRSPRNRRVSIVVLKGETVDSSQFDRLPRFLERANQPAPNRNEIGEQLRPTQPQPGR